MSAPSLYDGLVLEHGRRPRNARPVAHATHGAAADNPLCGDAVRVALALADGAIRDAGFEGQACAVTTASASLMTEHVRGKTPAEARLLAERMETLCTGPAADATAAGAVLGELAVFAGVRRHPARARCATLAWHALRRALAD